MSLWRKPNDVPNANIITSDGLPDDEIAREEQAREQARRARDVAEMERKPDGVSSRDVTWSVAEAYGHKPKPDSEYEENVRYEKQFDLTAAQLRALHTGQDPFTRDPLFDPEPSPLDVINGNRSEDETTGKLRAGIERLRQRQEELS